MNQEHKKIIIDALYQRSGKMLTDEEAIEIYDICKRASIAFGDARNVMSTFWNLMAVFACMKTYGNQFK